MFASTVGIPFSSTIVCGGALVSGGLRKASAYVMADAMVTTINQRINFRDRPTTRLFY